MNIPDAAKKITVLRLEATSSLSQNKSVWLGRSPGMCVVCLLAVIPLLREVEKDHCVTETKQLCLWLQKAMQTAGKKVHKHEKAVRNVLALRRYPSICMHCHTFTGCQMSTTAANPCHTTATAASPLGDTGCKTVLRRTHAERYVS